MFTVGDLVYQDNVSRWVNGPIRIYVIIKSGDPFCMVRELVPRLTKSTVDVHHSVSTTEAESDDEDLDGILRMQGQETFVITSDPKRGLSTDRLRLLTVEMLLTHDEEAYRMFGELVMGGWKPDMNKYGY